MTVVSSLAPYVTSAFDSHSLLPITTLVSSIVTGVMQLPLSRAIDRYGRPQGLIAMLFLDVLGAFFKDECVHCAKMLGRADRHGHLHQCEGLRRSPGIAVLFHWYRNALIMRSKSIRFSTLWVPMA